MNRNKTWLGQIAAAISALCGMIISLVGVADEGIEMLDKSVKSARERQAIDLEIDMADYQSNAIALASVRTTEVQEKVQSFVNDGGPKRADAVQTNHDRLKALVEAELNRIKASRVNKNQ
jgi:hypothetical protein